MKYRAMMRQKRNGKRLPAARVERHQNVAKIAIGNANINRAMSKDNLTSSAMRRWVFLK